MLPCYLKNEARAKCIIPWLFDLNIIRMQKAETVYEKNFPEFLSGGGEMGECIRNFDWSKTPLGDFGQWPQSLRTCVRIMLTSPQPMFVWWGKELTSIYNDAYKCVLGEKHPKALGAAGNETWKEIWHEVGARAEIVFNKNEGTYDEALLLIMNRHGYDEETYFKFSYSPVPGDKGETAGLFCACTEETERVISERQLSTLQTLAINIAQSTSANEVFTRSIKTLRENPYDFPFAVIYSVSNDGKTLSLAAGTVDELQMNFPAEINLATQTKKFHGLANAVLTKKPFISEHLSRRFGDLPSGAWNKPPVQALSIPVMHSSQHIPYAVLKIGINPFRRLDNKYQNFFQLVADQIAASLSNIYLLEEERKRAEALAEIDKAKTVFFSNISHEFRTPITLMLGPLEDLLNKPHNNLSSIEKQSIVTAHRNAMRMLKLVNTLLDFSSIESGRQKAVYTRTDLGLLTQNLASNFQPVIEKAGIEFIMHTKTIIRPVYVDRHMWEKIVFNLVSNAFKYTPEGKIIVSLAEENDHAVLTVEDTGIGIPEKELPHIFERFHRVQQAAGRTYEGTGIGLSLIKEFIALHGGTIGVESTEGAGSKFIVRIPFGKDHLPDSKITDDEQAFEEASSNLYLDEAVSLVETEDAGTETISAENGVTNTEKVLIVDDNPDMRKHIRSLVSARYKTVTARNGLEALQKVYTEKPHVILSDIMMPGMDGIQLLKEVKENPHTANIPVILITARAGDESKVEGYETGADDYLVKPFSSKELVARISSQIRIVNARTQIEKQLRDFLEQAPAAIAVLSGQDHIFTLANPLFQKLFGRREEQLPGKTIREVWGETKGQGIHEILDDVFASGKPFIAHEFPVTFIENEIAKTSYCDFVASPIKDKSGQVTDIMIHAFEVTEQIESRKKIEESERRFRTMADETPAFVWLTDEHLQTTFINNTGLAYFNLDASVELKDLSWKKFIHPEDLEPVLAVMRDAAQKHQPYTLEMRLKNGVSGKYRWFLDKGVPRYSENKFIGFTGTSFDIDDSKTSEKALRESEEKFRSLSEKLEKLVIERTAELNTSLYILQHAEQTANMGDWQWNLETNKLSWSDNLYRLFGYEPHEMEPTPENFLHIVHPDDKKRIVEHNQKAFETRRPTADIFRIITKSGVVKYIRGIGSCILINDTDYFIGTFVDVSELFEATETIKEVNRQLEQKNEALQYSYKELEKLVNELQDQKIKDEEKDNFILMASHELKTPVTTIKGYIQLLLEMASSNGKEATPIAVEMLHPALRSIDKQVKSLVRLISELLDLSKINKGQLVLHKELFNLNKLLTEAIYNNRFITTKHTIKYTEKGSYYVMADKERIEQVINNLLSNAIKYSPDAQDIELSVFPSGQDHVSVSIKDYGIGIAKTEHHKVFERFYRATGKNEQTYPGFGIGLFIAHDIIKRHNGTIYLESEKDKGSVFTFTLPLVKI